MALLLFEMYTSVYIQISRKSMKITKTNLLFSESLVYYCYIGRIYRHVLNISKYFSVKVFETKQNKKY